MRLAFSIIVLIAVCFVPCSERAQEEQQPPYLTTGAANVQACEKLIYKNEPTAWSGGYCFGVIEGV
jgi:hypothetical protein